MMPIDPFSMILIVAFAAVSMYIHFKLKSKFKKYSKIYLRNGMTGREIAEKMLADHGIRGVKIISTPGQLTDHYNPKTRTVNLSEAVYNERNAAAAAVAAHEVGHAVQHAKAYSWLELRTSLVPIVSVSSKYMMWVIIAGLALFGTFPYLFWAGIILFATTTLFSFITLPVEYDASSRALAWFKRKNMLSQQEYVGAEDALKWAARTYLAAALGSLATLVYYIMIASNRR